MVDLTAVQSVNALVFILFYIGAQLNYSKKVICKRYTSRLTDKSFPRPP